MAGILLSPNKRRDLRVPRIEQLILGSFWPRGGTLCCVQCLLYHKALFAFLMQESCLLKSGNLPFGILGAGVLSNGGDIEDVGAGFCSERDGGVRMADWWLSRSHKNNSVHFSPSLLQYLWIEGGGLSSKLHDYYISGSSSGRLSKRRQQGVIDTLILTNSRLHCFYGIVVMCR